MKYFLVFIYCWIFLLIQESKCQTRSALSIWTPRKATPAYVEQGGRLCAEVIAPETLSHSGWKVELFSDLGKRWDCRFLSAQYSKQGLDLGTKSGWKIKFTVPKSAVPELCALKIISPKGEAEIRPDAVSVVPSGSLNNSFYGVLFTDEHIFRNAAIGPDGANSMENLRLSAKVLNIANPRFMACPGDYSTAQSKREEDWIEGNYLSVKSTFKVPTLQSTGNHEYDHWQNVQKTIPLDFTFADYEQYFGQRSYLAKIGPVVILMHEINTNQLPLQPDSLLMKRVVSMWSTGLKDTSTKYRVIIQHCFDPAIGAFIPEKHGLVNGCNLMLGGHVHKTVLAHAPADGSSYYRLYGAAAERYGRSEWFNFNKDSNNQWSCPQANSTYCDSINTTPLYANALGKDLNLSAVYTYANDGSYTGTSNSCTITNKIKFNFYDGRIRFLMPKGKYVIQGGILLGQYDFLQDNVTKTAVICKINIPAKSTEDGSATVMIHSVAL